MDYHRCSFLWPAATLLDVSSSVPTLAATLREYHECNAARQVIGDAMLLHDRMVLEAMGVLPPRDLSASANASVLVSAYVSNDRHFEQIEERLLATPTPQGMACTLQLLSKEAADACLAVLPKVCREIQLDDTTPMLSLVLGDGPSLPKIGDELSSHERARLVACLPDMAQRLSRLAQWWTVDGHASTPFPSGLAELLPTISDIAPLRLKVPQLMTLLEAYALEVGTRPAPGQRPMPRL